MRYPADMTISPRRQARASVLALILGGSALLSWMAWAATAPPNPLASVDGESRTMLLAGEPFVVELASTPASRQRGLMGRSQLEAGHGMLFLYADEAPRAFWMRNVHFELDILYLDTDWRIVDRVVAAPPCPSMPCGEYPAAQPARYVLELPARSSDRLGLAVGQQLEPPGRLP
ncbi:DUF192 domain-containing protein [Guyparkeria hydrothermalis]|uniref:DUF192 domain-containing protein n=1 Tax=Guyparkeria hydrothermalis TaxID=923 RepID=UPI0020211788|nr:DUF192 domain-containing protein [Guyparkeria hydrothermalis]MCL7745222.1 DUF192 domain-containing protein [Guyparkeria hydrothermalis]